MIRVARAPEPPDFDAEVRRPGQIAMLELSGQATRRIIPGYSGRVYTSLATTIDAIPAARIPALWQGVGLQLLRTAYKNVCAYLGMALHPSTGAATVDHFLPKSVAPGLAYEWDNYRLASSSANRSKDDATGILDPFEIENDWFFLNLQSGELTPQHDLPDEIATAVWNTIAALNLNDPTHRKSRLDAIDAYLGANPSYHVGLDYLDVEMPVVAWHLRRSRL